MAGVSPAVSLAWAGGTLGSSTLLGALGLVVLFYLTEYLGLSPGVAGTLIFLSRLWDIGAALWVGQWSDRSRSRFGRRAPFLFAGGPVCALAYVALFAAPALEGLALQAWVLLALLLWASGYSLFVVPYLAVPAEITDLPQQRTTMMAYRVVFVTAAGLNVAVLGPLLIDAFGKGRGGYLGMALVQAAIVLAAMWQCAAVVARTPVVESASGGASAGGSLAQVRAVLGYRPFAVYLLVKLCQLTAAASTSAALLYLARYVLGRDESFLVRFGTLQMAGTLLSLPLWTWLGRRHGKREVYLGAGVLYALVSLSWLPASAAEAGWVTDLRLLAIGVGATGLLVMGFALLPDIMAAHTRERGAALEGTMGALYSVVEKGTAALGPLIGGVVLEMSGFVSSAGKALPPAQPPAAITAIVALAAVVPTAFNLLGSLALTRLRLDDSPATGPDRTARGQRPA
ncbi:MAG: MFS transporter [Steroidobacteraceae bacterium]|nr:MFS transporter [Steroidobacteraceae bacterium]